MKGISFGISRVAFGLDFGSAVIVKLKGDKFPQHTSTSNNFAHRGEISSDVLRYLNRHLRTAGWHAAQMRSVVEIETKYAADDFVTQADKELDVIIGGIPTTVAITIAIIFPKY